MDPAGIRLGTPALTTRGMGADEMRRIAAWILPALRSPADAGVVETTRREVAELAEQFPGPAARLDPRGHGVTERPRQASSDSSNSPASTQGR